MAVLLPRKRTFSIIKMTYLGHILPKRFRHQTLNQTVKVKAKIEHYNLLKMVSPKIVRFLAMKRPTWCLGFFLKMSVYNCNYQMLCSKLEIPFLTIYSTMCWQYNRKVLVHNLEKWCGERLEYEAVHNTFFSKERIFLYVTWWKLIILWIQMTK